MILFLSAALAAAAPATVAPTTTAPASCPAAATPDALVCRALRAQADGDLAGAAESFQEAARGSANADVATARLWAAAGNLWIAADEPGKAAFALDQALASPNLQAEQRGEALLDRARAAEAQGDLKTARARLNEAATTIADDPFTWYFSAALAIRENDPATAKSAIARALMLAPSDATILFEAGHVADIGGDEAGARSYWMRAAANDPTGEVGKAARKAIEMLGVTPSAATEPQPAR